MASDVQVQIERRRRRAAEEIARIANRDGHPVYGSFEVVSRSGNRYQVEIRSLEEPHNSCTCPDYRTNLIGTCKHIEGVLGSLRERYGEELGRLAGKRPAAPSVYLEYGQEIAVRLAGAAPRRRELRALMERHFDPQGVLVGDPLVALPALLGGLERLPAGRRVRVDPAVQEHLELVRDRDAVERQKAWWLGEVRAGRRSFDLLAHRLYPFQEAGALHLAFGRRAMLADDMGLGKGLVHGTPVLTPNGWRPVESLEEGDEVIGCDGTAKRVLGVYHRGVLPVFRVTFNDGASITVDGEHLWKVQHVRNDTERRYPGRPEGRWRVLDTATLARDTRDGVGNANWRIPLVKPVRFANQQERPPDAYLLGLLLGDGGMSTPHVNFSSADSELVEHAQALAPEGITLRPVAAHDYRVASAGAGVPNPVIRSPKALGLMGKDSREKFIPVPYLLADPATRLAVLQGLLDADGAALATGIVEFSTTSEQLMEDVTFIVQSLGGAVRCGQRRLPKGVSYRLRIKMTQCPFRLPRKAEAWRPPTKYLPTRIIQNIAPAGTAAVTCIAVDAPDELFVTKDFIVTHNTVQAIAAAALLKELRGIGRVLVVTPASLKHQWAREIRRFSSLGASVVEGPAKVRRQIYHSRAFFLILNYELVRYDLEELERLQPDLVILDEAQRIKNWRTKTAAAVKRLRSRYAFVLTGTPLENRLDELYSIFQFLDPRILGPLWRFNDRFFQLERRHSGRYQVLGYKNLGELRRLIAPYLLRRRREEVLHDLPERTVNNFFVPMTEAQWSAYKPYLEAVARLLALAKRRPLTPDEAQKLLNCLTIMRLICDALALHDKDIPDAEVEKTAPKLGELAQVLEETLAEDGAKALIFSAWTGMLALVEPVLERLGLGYVTLTGDVPTPQRGKLIDRFFEDPDCRVFLSTEAGGLGLNLHAASVVINLDLPWNPAVLEQRIGRAHRHGQTRSVQVINLIAQGTIEERILDTLAAKRRVFSGVLDEGDLPEAISFQDTGQGLLQRLQTMLDGAAAPILELEPASVGAAETRPVEAAEPALDFAQRLIGRLPGRVLLVGRPSGSEGVLVVVDREPAELRSQVESVLAECLGPQPPPLHLMEREGYQALTALLPADRSGETIYRSPALPDPAARAGGGRQGLDEARKGLDQAARRLAFAELAQGGGFHEEVGGPLAEALGWALSSLLALAGAEVSPSPQLPPPRLVQTALVEPGSLPEELAGRLARVRELATPDGEGGPATLSPRTVEQLVSAVGELVQLGREAAVRASL